MSQVQIQKPTQKYEFNDFLFGRWAEHVRQIEKRAHQLFVQRGLVHGGDFDDWLQAEREVNSQSSCQVKIGEKAVTIVVSAPGFSRDDITVNIIPGLATVEGEAEQQTSGKRHGIVADEEITWGFFHRIRLPDDADTDAASAAFLGEELHISVPLKAAQTVPPKVLAAGQAAN